MLVSAGFDAMAAIRSAGSPWSRSTTPTDRRGCASDLPRPCRSSACSRADTYPRAWPRARLAHDAARWRLVYHPPFTGHSRLTRGRLASASPDGSRESRAPHPASLHHRPRGAERLPHGVGPADRRRRQRRLGRGGADASSTARRRRPCSPRSTLRHGAARGSVQPRGGRAALGERCCGEMRRRGLRSPPRCTTWWASGSAFRSTGSGDWTLPRRRDPPSPSASTLRRRIRTKVLEAEQYPILKIKLGTDRDVEILRTIRGATDKEIRVDANCGWTVKQAIRDAPGAGGVRSDGAGAAAASERAGRAGRDHRAGRHPGDRRRELQDRRRYSAAGGQGGRHQHQAGQVRQPARGAPDDRHRAGARTDGHGRAA